MLMMSREKIEQPKGSSFCSSSVIGDVHAKQLVGVVV